jgi:hypothetical protein
MKVKINKTPFILNLLILTFSIPTIKKQKIDITTQTHYSKTNDINKSIKKLTTQIIKIVKSVSLITLKMRSLLSEMRASPPLK